jgi:acetolactate decarboxylase
MKSITCNLPDSIYQALNKRMETGQASCDHVVSVALSRYLGKPIHTLFQVSTSAALVEADAVQDDLSPCQRRKSS